MDKSHYTMKAMSVDILGQLTFNCSTSIYLIHLSRPFISSIYPLILFGKFEQLQLGEEHLSEKSSETVIFGMGEARWRLFNELLNA